MRAVVLQKRNAKVAGDAKKRQERWVLEITSSLKAMMTKATLLPERAFLHRAFESGGVCVKGMKK